ncbi:MAG: hypothetical protein QNJ73_12165 [Gammaproteobacteria bacterium]|nr:hypothetical protein [Gammaproteobacteria bacterium]
MNNDNLASNMPAGQAEKLRSIAGELSEVHSLLAALCKELSGGGIVQARDLEPMIAETVPKLRHAVRAMQGIETDSGDDGEEQNPLLM